MKGSIRSLIPLHTIGSYDIKQTLLCPFPSDFI